MRLNVLAASALAAGASARSNPLVERELAARALVNVNPAGSICPPVPTTVIVLQPGINGTATTTITTTTTIFPGQSTTTTASATRFVPPFTLGEGLPSGGVTNLPFEQFLFLAYQTPAPAPLNKRDADLVRRQARPQNTATPITLVDLNNAAPSAPAQGPANCDNATPLNLVNGVLNGKGFSLGKLLDSRDAILGYLNSPPPVNQVNITFSIQSGILQWNTPDVGGASFYNCANQIFAGFPNLNIAGCSQVIVGPIAGQVCIQYVTSTRSVNPTFTAPLTSTGSGSSSATATGTGASSASGTGGNGNTSATGTGGNGSTSATGTGGSGNTSATGTGTGGNGNPSATSTNGGGQGTTTNGGSQITTTTTTTSSAPGTTTSAGQCLIQLPGDCLAIGGLAAGLNLVNQAAACLTAITSPAFQATPNLNLAGLGTAATCLVDGLTSSGDSILACLQSNIVCGPGGAPATTSAGGVCAINLPGSCTAIGGLPAGLGLVTAAGACLTSILSPSFQGQPGLDLTGLTTAVGCLGQGLLTPGSTILTCLQTNLVCLGGSGQPTTSAAPTSTGLVNTLLNCIPVAQFANCAALTGLSGVAATTQAALCLTGLLTAQTNGGLTPAVTTGLVTALQCVNPTTLATQLLTNPTLPGAGILSCITGAGVVSC